MSDEKKRDPNALYSREFDGPLTEDKLAALAAWADQMLEKKNQSPISIDSVPYREAPPSDAPQIWLVMASFEGVGAIRPIGVYDSEAAAVQYALEQRNSPDPGNMVMNAWVYGPWAVNHGTRPPADGAKDGAEDDHRR